MSLNRVPVATALATALAAALCSLGTPSTAVAQPAPISASDAWVEPTFVAFERLEARLERGEVVVEYEISRAAWRWLRDAGISPSLSVKVTAHGRPQETTLTHRALELRRPRGRLAFRPDARPIDFFDEVELALTGHSRTGDVGGFELGGFAVRRAIVPVAGVRPHRSQPLPPVPAPAPGTQWAAHPDVIRACGAGFDGDASETACLDLVARAVIDPRPALTTCDQLMDGDPSELACLGIAVDAHADRSAALRRCDAGYDGDEAELACFRTVVGTAWEPSAAIEACDAAGNGDASEQACLAVAVRASVDPTATIRACDQAMSGDDALLACMRRAMR